MKKILVLDNYDSFTYNIVHYIKELGYNNVDVFRNDEILIQEIDKYDTIILSPGPGIPKEAGILNDVINTYAPTKNILGVCLGMQAIGEVFGAKLLNLEKVYHGVATSVNILDSKDFLYRNIPSKINVGRYHSWIVDSIGFPSILKITSEDENGQIMSLKHNNFNVFGVQYHPESILTEYGKEIIHNFLKL